VSAADWGPDGASLAVIRHEGTKVRLEFPIGKVLYESDVVIYSPRVSPRGDQVAFIEAIIDSGGEEVRVVDLAGKVTTLANNALSGLVWSPRGDEIWYADWGVLRAVTLAGRQRVLTHFPGPITINDVSPDGRVLVTTAQWYQHLMFAGPGDAHERDLAWFEWALPAALSHDGKTLLFGDRGRGGGGPQPVHAYLRRTDGAPAVRLGEGRPVALSPDGKWAISRLGTRPWHCVLLPTGPGEPRSLPLGDLECAGASWFPDGKRLAVTGIGPANAWRVYVQDVDGGTRRPLTPEGFSLGDPVYEPSPDGKRVLAMAADGSGRHMVFPADGGEPKAVPSLGPREVSAGWGADSQSLYIYAEEADLPVRIDKLDLRTGRRVPFRTLAPPDVTAFGGIYMGRVTPDENAYVYSYGQFPCVLYVIEGLR
jgi:Tol biopolymer transport system component